MTAAKNVIVSWLLNFRIPMFARSSQDHTEDRTETRQTNDDDDNYDDDDNDDDN